RPENGAHRLVLSRPRNRRRRPRRHDDAHRPCRAGLDAAPALARLLYRPSEPRGTGRHGRTRRAFGGLAVPRRAAAAERPRRGLDGAAGGLTRPLPRARTRSITEGSTHEARAAMTRQSFSIKRA